MLSKYRKYSPGLDVAAKVPPQRISPISTLVSEHFKLHVVALAVGTLKVKGPPLQHTGRGQAFLLRLLPHREKGSHSAECLTGDRLFYSGSGYFFCTWNVFS